MPFFTHPKAFHDAPNAPGLVTLDQSRSRLFSASSTWATNSSPPPPHSSHPALPHLTLLVFEAVLEVVCVSLPGYIVARHGMFTAEMQKFAANLNVVLFTPCLIFIKLASKLTIDKMAELAVIPVIFIAQTLVSYLCSLLVSKLLRLPKRPRNFVIAMGVFGNSNSLPISLVISLSQTISGLHWDKVYHDNDSEVQARGILYLLIFQQLGQLLRWSWGYNVLLAPSDKVEGTSEHTNSGVESGSREEHAGLIDYSQESDEEEHDGSASEATQVGAEGPGLESSQTTQATSKFPSGEQTPVIEQQNSSASSSKCSIIAMVKGRGDGAPPIPPTGGSVKTNFPGSSEACQKALKHARTCTSLVFSTFARCKVLVKGLIQRTIQSISLTSSHIFRSLPPAIQTALRKVYRNLKRFGAGVWEFMNPPLWAMFAAIIVASIPDLQHLFFAEGTFVKNSVTSAISQSSGVAVPLILVVLGGNLARNTLPSGNDTEDEIEGTRLLVAALISRMLLPFVVMAPLLAIAAKYVPVSILDDPIFVIVCFLITGAPSALQLAQICQINNVYVKTMTGLLFQSYVVWILPSTLVLVLCALEVVEWAQQG